MGGDEKNNSSASEYPIERFQVSLAHAGLRLDKALAMLLPKWSRSRLKELCDVGHVQVGSRVCEGRYQLRLNEEICIRLVPRAYLRGVCEPTLPELVVLHEDSQILVVDKAAGVVVHPGAGHLPGTLSEAAVVHCGKALPSSGDETRAGIVHRLDRETSGVIVLAKTEKALRHLQEQFAQRRTKKEYRALVFGVPRFMNDRIEKMIGRDPKTKDRMKVVHEGGKEAVTDWELRRAYDGFAELICRPKTGRTHQIRVHMAWFRHSVVGDSVYKARSNQGLQLPKGAPDPARHCLHAQSLAFAHPNDDRPVRFEAPLPADLRELFDWLARELPAKDGSGKRGGARRGR